MLVEGGADSKVDDFEVPFLIIKEHDVLGLEISVHHSI